MEVDVMVINGVIYVIDYVIVLDCYYLNFVVG